MGGSSATSRDAWDAISQPPLQGLARLGQEEPWAEWAGAVCHMAAGDYSRAFLILQPLARPLMGSAEDEHKSPSEVNGLAITTLASGLRQLNDHERALQLDRAALAAPGAAGVDSKIGTAADYVGLGAESAATEALAAAQPVLSGWRDHVRYAWVAAEIDLMRGEPLMAAAHLEGAIDLAREHSSPRHLIKSELFFAVAQEVSRPGAGVPLLREVVGQAAQLQLRPLLWPAVEVLADRASADERRMGIAAVDYISAHLPHGVGARWAGISLKRSLDEGRS